MTTKIKKLDRDTYKYIESEIKFHERTVEEYKTRRQEILYDRNGPDQEGGQSNLPSSPTERYALRLIADRRLARLQTVIDAVNAMLESCDDKQKQFVELYFHARPQTKTIDGIAYEMEVSRRTIFRMRDEVVYSVAKLMGEW